MQESPENEITIQVNGKPAKATRVTLSSLALPKEHWNEYTLEDGTIIRLKIILKSAIRVKDHYDKFGQPVYLLQHTTVSDVNSPECMRKK